MGLATFDTYEVAQSLEQVGFPKEQVAALTKAFLSSRSNPEAVSQSELREHKAEVKSETIKVKANIKESESKVLQAIESLRHEVLDLRKDMDTKFAAIDSKFESQHKDMDAKFTAIDSKMDAKFAAIDSKFESQRKDMDTKFAVIDSKIEISRKSAESLINKAKFHLLSWMVALTLGPTVFRNLWQFLSITGVSH